MMSIRSVKAISAIIVIVLVQCTLIKSHSAARGSIQIHTATTDTSGRAGELTYSVEGAKPARGSNQSHTPGGSGSGNGYEMTDSAEGAKPARGSIQILTATTDTSGRAGELEYSGRYFKAIKERRNRTEEQIKKDEKRTNCKAGEGVNVPIIMTETNLGGTCITKKAYVEVGTKSGCNDAYVLLDAIWSGYGHGAGTPVHAYGRPSKCVLQNNNWFFDNTNTTFESDSDCGTKEETDCICLIPECSKCPKNTYSEGGLKQECKPCRTPFLTNKERTRCLDIVRQLNKQKEKQNDLSTRNSRLWQKEEIRMEHDKIMQERKEKDNKNETEHCKYEREKGTVIFPAMEISQEIEKVEDTTCLDMNRDELLKSFCSFTSKLDELFHSQNITKIKANSFFPNICCKERKDKTLEVCEDPSGKIERRDIIPFALSQGGDYSRHNVYAEVSDALKFNGYLHEGMKKMLNSLKKDANNAHIIKMVDSFFQEISLCGPRIINAPGKNENTFCQLFVPYQHAMKEFYKLVHSMYDSPKLRAQAAGQGVSFLQIMEHSFRKRQYRLGKNNGVKNIGAVIKAKAASPKSKVADEKCSVGSEWSKKELNQTKDTFCTGYKHLDLSTPQINNFAMHYIQNDINAKCAKDDKCMETLTTSLRYEVTDSTCPSPLFTANDISLQKINMDGLGKVKKEWAAVVKLNTKSENGYLKSELPYCKARDYLIGTKVKVKAYVDVDSCCDGLVDYEDCKKKKSCQKEGVKLVELEDKNRKHFSKDVKVTGTRYKVKDSHSTELGRRRRLLHRGRSGC